MITTAYLKMHSVKIRLISPFGSPLSFVAILLMVGLALESDGLLVPTQRQEIRDFVTPVIDCRNVAGLSLGIVFGDGTDPSNVFTQGFGLSDVERNRTVREDTQFALGALTSTFTTTLISKLLHSNKNRFPNGWDTTLQEVFGKDFRLSDPLRTDYTTFRDLAAHKTGYPRYHSLVTGLDPTVERAEYCRRYFLLEPQYEFRADFHYSREMFTLLGCVAEVIGNGASWEELVQSYILDPLGMTSTSFVSGSTNQMAKSYAHHNNSFLRLDERLLGAIYPNEVGEGMISSSADMVKWMQYHILNLHNLSRIQEGRLLEEIYLPQIQYKLGTMREFEPQSSVHHAVFAHNLGWESGLYRGYRLVQKNGQLAGYTSKMTVFRDINLGIFIGMNSGMSSMDAMTADIITWHIADLLLQVGRPSFLAPPHACFYEYQFAHEGLFRSRYPNSETPAISQARVASVKSFTTRKPKWESAYVGDYGHRVFGNITVSYSPDENTLLYKAGHLGVGILRESSVQDEYVVEFRGPLSYMKKMSSEQLTKLSFKEFKDDRFTSVEILGDGLSYTRGVTWDIQPSSQSSQSDGQRNELTPFLVIFIILLRILTS